MARSAEIVQAAQAAQGAQVIGIDTNVLLRFLFADDPVQSAKARALIEQYGTRPDSVRLTDVVMVEMTWVLRRVYGSSRAAVIGVVEQLLADPAFAFSSRPRVRRALDDCRRMPLDFADCLIAQDNTEAGCDFTATFDRRMRGSPRVRLL